MPNNFTPQSPIKTGESSSSINLSNSLYSNLMQTKERFSSVYLEQPKYNVLSQLIDMVAPAKQIDQRRFERSRMGQTGVTLNLVAADVNDISASSPVVTVKFDSATKAAPLRHGDVCRVVTSGVAYQYYVSQEATGADNEVKFTILQEAVDGTDTTAATGHFAAGTSITVLFDSHKNDFSEDDKKPLFYVPESRHNFTGVCRDSVHISRDALHKGTYELWDGKYWAFAQEKLMRMRFSKSYEQKLLLAQRYESPGGGVPEQRSVGGGVLWFIENFGQTFEKTTDFDLDDINDIIYNILTIAATGTSEVTVLCGAYFLKRFQEEAANKYIQYVGVANTIGGNAVRGISAFEYNVLGVSVKFIHYPAWDDPKLFPEISTTLGGIQKSSANALFLDMTSVEGTDGLLPGIEKYYYGDQEMYYTYVPGMIGLDAGLPSNTVQGNYNLAANSKDGFSAHIMCDDGVFLNAPERHVFYKYTGA